METTSDKIETSLNHMICNNLSQKVVALNIMFEDVSCFASPQGWSAAKPPDCHWSKKLGQNCKFFNLWSTKTDYVSVDITQK